MGPFSRRLAAFQMGVRMKKKISDEAMAANRAEAGYRLRWSKGFQPQGPKDGFLVDEITISFWKLEIAETLESIR